MLILDQVTIICLLKVYNMFFVFFTLSCKFVFYNATSTFYTYLYVLVNTKESFQELM